MTPESPIARPRRFPLLARVAPLALGLLVAVDLATLGRRPFRSTDTYFQLRFGDEFRHGWSLAHPGQPSPASSNDWVPTQWLSQVGLSWIAERAGTTGLVLTFATACAALIAAIYLLLRRWTTVGPALGLTVLALLGLVPSLSLRPQVLSYLFFVVVLASWDHALRTGRTPWWLVPLAWLWAMSHGMWILGLGTSGLLALATCVQLRPGRAAAARLLAVPAAMALATCATPVGPKLVGAVLLVNSRAEYFQEWRAPELTSINALPVTVLLLLTVVLLARRPRVSVIEVTLAVLGVVFAVYSTRTLPLALITLAVVVAATLRRAPAGSAEPDRPARLARPELAAVAVLAALPVALAPVLPVIDRPDEGVRPFAARLEALPDETRVLTDRATGAILMWTEPQLDIPVHGYGDVYTDEELDSYDALGKLEPGWVDTLESLGARVALLGDDERLVDALERLGWQVVQHAEDRTMLTAPEWRP